MQYDMNRQPARPRAGFNNSLPAPTRASYIYAGIGALVGLIIGLVFAWLIWPVQWTNAWPADLSQEARAQYLAAVAESYVYYGDAEAAQVARNRLFNLNENLTDYIIDAQRFFVENPQATSRVYINNLGQLAQALNVQSPEIIIDTPVDVAPAAEGAVADAEASDTSAVGDGVRAWVNWALTVLAALVLVGGGFYVVGRLNQRRLATADGDTLDDGGFEDEPSYMRPAGGARREGFARPLRGVAEDAPAQSAPRTSTRASEDFGGFDEGFEDEEYYGRSAQTRALDYRSEDEIFDDPLDDQDFGQDPLAEIDNTLDSALGEPIDEPFAKSEPLYARQGTAAVIDDYDDDDDYDNEYDDSAYSEVEDDSYAEMDKETAASDDHLELTRLDEDDDYDEEVYVSADALGAEPLNAEPAAVAGRSPTGVRTINTYSFEYHAGIADYDQSRPIVDPESGLQVGDCGMGVNVKNNVVQNNPDNVVALDVWLVDKKQEKSFSSQDRVLLSEYVVDHNLESTFTRDRPNDPSPIIPQPGTAFQIIGPSLILDCVITDVSYIQNGSAAGMFQSLSIDMTVRSH